MCGQKYIQQRINLHTISHHITHPPTDVHTYVHSLNPMHRPHTRVVHTRSGSPQLLLLHTTCTGYTLKLGGILVFNCRWNGLITSWNKFMHWCKPHCEVLFDYIYGNLVSSWIYRTKYKRALDMPNSVGLSPSGIQIWTDRFDIRQVVLWTSVCGLPLKANCHTRVLAKHGAHFTIWHTSLIFYKRKRLDSEL